MEMKIYERSLQALLSSAPRSRVLARHALLAKIGELARRLASKRGNGLQNRDQFSFLGNRALYEFIELDMSTGLDMSIPRSRPLTFPGEQSKDGYRGR